MKNTFVILAASILVLNLTVAKAQNNFPIDTLEKICKFNSSDFENWILKKGFSYSSDGSTKTLKKYRSDFSLDNGKKNVFFRADIGLNHADIIFHTTDKSYYLNFKTGLKNKGYKFSKEEPIVLSGGVSTTKYVYYNPWYLVKTFSYSEAGITWYAIECLKN